MDEQALKLRLFESRFNEELQRGLNMELRALAAEALVEQLQGVLHDYHNNQASSGEDLSVGAIRVDAGPEPDDQTG